jgi:hypothetical protein
MRTQARQEYEGKYASETNYAQLIDIYESAAAGVEYDA